MIKTQHKARRKQRVILIKLLHSMWKIKHSLKNHKKTNLVYCAIILIAVCYIGGCVSYFKFEPIKHDPIVVQVEQKPELPDLSKTMPYVPLTDIGKPEANPVAPEPIKINVKHVKKAIKHITPTKPIEPIKSIESKELDNQKEVVRKSLVNTFKWLVSFVLVFLGIIYIAHKRIK